MTPKVTDAVRMRSREVPLHDVAPLWATRAWWRIAGASAADDRRSDAEQAQGHLPSPGRSPSTHSLARSIHAGGARRRLAGRRGEHAEHHGVEDVLERGRAGPPARAPRRAPSRPRPPRGGGHEVAGRSQQLLADVQPGHRSRGPWGPRTAFDTGCGARPPTRSGPAPTMSSRASWSAWARPSASDESVTWSTNRPVRSHARSSAPGTTRMATAGA